MAFIDYKNIGDDILIENGDFVKDDCAQDHITDIIIANKGDYKQSPLVGVGLIKYVNGPITPQSRISLNKQIRLQLEADQYRVRLINTDDFENIQIEASK